MVNLQVLLVASIVVVAVVVGVYFLLKKEKYSAPKSAVISLNEEAQAAISDQEIKTAIQSLQVVLGDIQIEVVGPSEFIPCGYRGAIVVYYTDGSHNIQPFGKTLGFVGHDLLHLYRRFE